MSEKALHRPFLTPASVAEIGVHFDQVTGTAGGWISRLVLKMADGNKQFASKLQTIEVKIARNAKI